MDGPARISVVITTRNRRERLLGNLGRLLALPERPPVVVVDDASTDGTTAAVRGGFPEVTVLRLERSLGAAARTHGVRGAATPYVAFADDDSWWEPGALDRAVRILDRHPHVGLLAARVLVEPDGRDDPTNEALATSPLHEAGLPRPQVLGFVACGAVVRREAYLDVGGFDPRLHIGGEEELLALDLRRHGWRCVHVPEVVAHHRPDPGPRPGRRRQLARNALWTAWLRRRWPAATRITVRGVVDGLTDPVVRGGVVEAMRALPAILRDRQALPRDVERARRRVERTT